MLTAKGYGWSIRGGRKCLKEITVGKVEKNSSYFAVFDGHCGVGAAFYAYKNLWNSIKCNEGFYSDDKETIKEAILGGFVKTQEDMFRKSPCFTPNLVNQTYFSFYISLIRNYVTK